MRSTLLLVWSLLTTLFSYQELASQNLACPPDTTINCGIFIDPEITGVAESAEGYLLFFVDSLIQSCPNDIILQRFWIAINDSTQVSDTCLQMITVEVVGFEEFSSMDTIIINDACPGQLSDDIQERLELPCAVGIDNVSLELIEEDCERSTLSATWQFSNQCVDSTMMITQVLQIENRRVAHFFEPTIQEDSGDSTGAIALAFLCDPNGEIGFLWSDSTTSSSLANVAAGDYSVTVSNEAGCSDTYSFTIATAMMTDTTGMQMDTMMMDTAGMQMDTMMMDTTGMQMDTMMMDTTDMQMDTMMMDTTGMQMDTMMMDTTDMQMDTMMMDTTDMQMDTMMMDTTGMMMDTMMMDTTGMQMDTMMMDTTGMMMDTMMMDTTGMQMDTMMMDTTGMQIDTMMMDTTGMQMDTMMIDTIGMQMDTMMMDTTGMQMDTMMMDTTGMQMDTMMMDTTGMQMDTMMIDTIGMQMDTMMMDTTGMQMDTMMMDTTGMQMDTMMMDTTGMQMDTMMMDTTGMQMDTMMMDTTGMQMDTMMMDTTGMKMDTMMMDTTAMQMDTMMMDTTGMQMDTMMMDTTGMQMDTMMMDTTDMQMDTMMMDTTGMQMDVPIDTANLGNSLTITILDRSGNFTNVDTLRILDRDSVLIDVSPSSIGAGIYQFDLGNSLIDVQSVCMEIDDEPRTDLSAQDIIVGQRQILQLIDGCPEDLVAGDVNLSGTLTAADLVSIRNVLLEKQDSFPSQVTWRFIEMNRPPTSQLCTPISNSSLNSGEMEVRAIKLGDFQCND